MKTNYTESELSDIMTKENMENIPNGVQENGEAKTSHAAQNESDSSGKSSGGSRPEANKTNGENGLTKHVPREEFEAVEKELSEVKDKLKTVNEEKVKVKHDCHTICELAYTVERLLSVAIWLIPAKNVLFCLQKILERKVEKKRTRN